MIDRRDIVPEFVQLTDGIMDGMKVKVRSDIIRVLIICRVLYGAEIIDLIALWHHYHATGMLAGRPFDAGAPLRQAQLLGTVVDNALFLLIFFHIADSRFIRYGSDGAGLKHVVLTKERLCVAVRTALIFAGEVEIDIRGFIAVKAEEGLKRNGVAIPVIIRSADRAFFRRQVKPGAIAAVCNKFTMLALRADIMRFQRIYL